MAVEKILSDVFNIPQTDAVDSLELRSIAAWDSLTHMMLIAQLEESYKIEFTGDEIADMSSVADIKRALQAHGVTQ